MINNLSCFFASLAVMNLVLAQNSTDNNTSLQWLNSLLLVPNVEMQNELLAANANGLNLNPEEVVQSKCVDEKGRQGVCVLHYQCQPHSRSLIKDGATILDVRENEGACPNVLEVCCMNIVTTTQDNTADELKENAHNSAIRNKCSLIILLVLQLYR